jgi:hypothetical protein
MTAPDPDALPPGFVTAADIVPGTTVVNCMFSAVDQHQVLDVVAVDPRDAELMVLVHAETTRLLENP